jgi:peptidoglycan/xylan/chitin deacetylase (PgdA/CDA1 family)
MKHQPVRRPIALVARIAVVVALATTSVAGPAHVAASDAPGGCSGAIAGARNTWISDTISTSSDVDWFKFSITSASRTLVTLGHLPADYDLYLYSGCSTLLASSHRGGAAFDEIYTYLGAGTYRVKVVGFAGAHSATAYALRFRPVAWGIAVLSSTTWTDAAGYLHVAGEVLNNTADNRRWVQIDATFRNSAGVALGAAVGYSDVATLRPGTRSTFEITARKPAGHAMTSLKVCTPSSTGGCLAGQVTTAPLGGLSVTPGATSVDAGGQRHYTGSVRNAGTTAAYLTRSLATQYDSYGNVRGLGAGSTSPSTLAAGTTGSFDVTASSTAAPNRVGYAVQATGTGCATSPRYATTTRENFIPPITRVSASGRVALTFDMGGRMTPAVHILNMLVANRVCSTIFATGAISRTPEGLAALAVIKAHPDLFEIGNHTMHHCDLVRGGGGSPAAADATYCKTLAPKPTQAQVQKELVDAEYWIRQATGMTVQPFWRAPYGSYDSTVLTWAAQAGYTKHVRWDIDTIDWKPIGDGGPSARAITLKVVNNARSGSVVLMHLGGFETPDALHATIDGLRSRGFVLTTLSDLVQ